MIKPADLPETIPLFPLPGAIVLPRARLPLHIFEPRYVAMLHDCMKTETRLIGMIQPRPTPKGEPRLAAIGCAGRLTAFSETEDGRYMITLTGISRFRMKEEVQGFAPYRRAKVDWTPFHRDLGEAENDPGLKRDSLFSLVNRFFVKERLGTDWPSLREAEPEMLINALSMLCPFATEDKQALLEAPSLTTRRETLVTLMEFALHGGEPDNLQ
jgi:uncharacterized protein